MVSFDEVWDGFKGVAEESNKQVWDTVWKDGVQDSYTTAQKDAAQSTGTTYQMNPSQVMDYYRDHGLELVKTLNETDKNTFKDLLEKNFDKPYEEFLNESRGSFAASDSRIKAIWNTERHDAYTNGYQDYVQDYVDETGAELYATWHHSGNPNPRPHHIAMHGITVRFGEAFPNGEIIPTGVNCGCWLEYRDHPPAAGEVAEPGVSSAPGEEAPETPPEELNPDQAAAVAAIGDIPEEERTPFQQEYQDLMTNYDTFEERVAACTDSDVLSAMVLDEHGVSWNMYSHGETVPLDIQKEMALTFNKIATDHPVILEKLETIGVRPASWNKGRWYMGATNTGTEIGLNADYWIGEANLDYAYKAMARDVASGFHPAGFDNPSALMAHELGHMVENGLLRQTDMAFLEYIGEQRIGNVGDTVAQWLNHAVSQGDTFISAISDYALHNSSEAWAEAFGSLYMTAVQEQATFTKQLGSLLGEIESNPWRAIDAKKMVVYNLTNFKEIEKAYGIIDTFKKKVGLMK